MSAILPFARLDSTRLLAFGGIALLIVGLVAGEIYAIYISHVANGILGRTWAELIAAVARGDATALPDSFAVISDLTAKRGRTMTTHSHVGGFGLLALALAYLQPQLELSERAKQKVALAYLAGAGVYAAGVYVSYYVADWTLYVADVGALLLILACGRTLLAFRWPANGAGPIKDQLLEHLQPPASRYLMRGGLLLVFVGMAFGLYYAWVLLSADEPRMFGAIVDAAAMAAQGNDAAARAAIAMFKATQSKVAITAAAHSHAIELGFLMLMLAFLQQYVMLTERWRLVWARVLTVGAFMLPVCVLLATRYGLRAAAFSDLFGGLVTLALLAMAFGIVRHTGSADTRTAIS